MAISKKDDEITILELKRGSFECYVLGESPYIFNAMSAKVRQGLLLPKGKKNAAEKASTAKHNPYEEYVSSAYKRRATDAGPTRLQLLGEMFKQAMVDAAKRVPGSSGTAIGQLTAIPQNRIDLYGVPQLLMSVTRSADMNRTPDIRTRMIIPQWACKLTVTFATPILNVNGVANLLAAAGEIIGVGDWRPEKGSGSYGRFRLVNEGSVEWKEIVKNGGIAAQDAAINAPQCFDVETEELLAWYDAESKRRGFKVAS